MSAQFLNLHEPERRDAQYETASLIDHLLYHKNTAPFIATRLLQRLTTSNPSPRYVHAVAQALVTGRCTLPGCGNFSGTYGDLGASVATALLDSEGMNPLLDAAPSHGGLREPIIKFLHLVRSMDYQSEDGREVELTSMNHAIGEAPYESPTVGARGSNQHPRQRAHAALLFTHEPLY